MIEFESVFARALKVWGQESQLRMAQEECAELIVAISKILREKPLPRHNGNPLENLFEEIADVKIMIGQLEVLFGPANIAHYVGKKIKRLEERLS